MHVGPAGAGLHRQSREEELHTRTSTNAATGVMGKMISLQSIAVAVAATGMASSEEGRLFRITLKHSIILALSMAVVTMIFAYLLPQLVPQV